MMYLAVKLAGKDNPKGLPEEWPVSTRKLERDEEPNPSEILMTDVEFRDYKKLHRAKYNTWRDAQSVEETPIAPTKLRGRNNTLWEIDETGNLVQVNR